MRQGGISSPDLYRMYVDPLLEEMKTNSLGAHIGTIYAGINVVADDFLFPSNHSDKLQVMLNVTKRYASERRYKIHPVKTTLVTRLTTTASREKREGREMVYR